MKIVAYSHVHRTLRPTGVGKHIINMIRGMARQPGVELRVLANAEDMAQVKASGERFAFEDLPVETLGGSRKKREWLWNVLGRPSADPIVGDAEWVYCPAETYVPVKKAKLAVTSHLVNFELPGLSRGSYWKTRMRWTLTLRPIVRHADVIFCVSEFLKGRLVELFSVDPGRIHVVGNGVEPVFYGMGEQAREASGRPYLLVVGGLTRLKGADTVLNVARVLGERKSPLEVHVAGPVDAEYQAPAAGLKNVVLLGYKGIEEMPRLVKNAEALLFPSLYETFGIPATEAMAAGTPVMASNRTALKEVVGDAGILADPGETEAFVTAATRLLEEPAFRESYVVRGRAQAAKFTWEKCVERAVAAMRNG